MRTYLNGKVKEMDGVGVGRPLPAKPLPTPKGGKKALPVVPGRAGAPSLRINDVLQQVENEINGAVRVFCSAAHRAEVCREETDVLESLRADFAGTVADENFRTKIESDIAVVAETVALLVN